MRRYRLNQSYKGYGIYRDTHSGGGYPRYVIERREHRGKFAVPDSKEFRYEDAFGMIKSAKAEIDRRVGTTSKIGAEFNPYTIQIQTRQTHQPVGTGGDYKTRDAALRAAKKMLEADRSKAREIGPAGHAGGNFRYVVKRLPAFRGKSDRRLNPTSYGTSYFVNLAAAIRYYRPYHYTDTKAAVQRKLADGEIHIGKPPLKPGDTLQVIDGGTRYQITEGKRNPEAGLYDRIRPGSRVTIVNRFGQTQSGRAVMLGPAGWVLNLGGRHGTPGIAHPGNIVKVSGGHKARTLREASITGTAINPAKLNPGQLLFQSKEQALLYAATHGLKAFDLKPIKKTA